MAKKSVSKQNLTGQFFCNDDPGLLKYNYIGGQLTTTLTGNPSGWDKNLGEMGNVCRIDYDVLIQAYSAYIEPYAQNDVYIGLNVSIDNGLTWTKGGPLGDGKIIAMAAEDPYIVFDDTTLYLFVEDKQTVPFVSVKMYTAVPADLTTWTDRGVVLLNGAPGQWDDKDASSPTVSIKNGEFRLLYEGRRASGQAGAMGLATAPVSLTPTFTKYAGNPILSGTQIGGQVKWATNLVPDDFLEINEIPYVIFHASNGLNFVEGIAVGDASLQTWQDYLGCNLGKANEYTGKGIALNFDGMELQTFFVDIVTNTIVRGQLLNQASADFGGKDVKGNNIYAHTLATDASATKLVFRNPTTFKFGTRNIVNSDITQAFGSNTAGSTGAPGYIGDFNNVQNLQPGFSNWTMRGNATNSPAGATSSYFQVFNAEMGLVKDGTHTTSQVLFPIGTGNAPNTFFHRENLNGALSPTWLLWPNVTSQSTVAGQVLVSQTGTNLYTPVTPTGTGKPAFSISPAFTGIPTAPTAAAGTNTTQVATTAHVLAERTNAATLTNKTLTNPILTGYTVATLPAGTVGMMAYVTDAAAPTYLGALTGGGTVTCPVFYDGTAWVAY